MVILHSAIISLAFALLFLNGLPVHGQEIGERLPASIRNRIVKLEAKLKQHPGDIRCRTLLADAQLRAARKLSDKPEIVMQFLHRAQLLDPQNPHIISELNAAIRKIELDPHSFEDRVYLGDAARKRADFSGAIVEYGAALNIKNDPAVHERRGDVYRVRDENDNALTEYIAAIKMRNSASLQVKIGQAYLAKGEVDKARIAYKIAETMKSDDPLFQAALDVKFERSDGIKSKKHDQDLSSDYTESQTGEFDSLCQQIKLAWQPPREQNFESAKIKIRLFADGHFSQLKMIKESNSHLFNQSAIRALKKSAPFTALPANFPSDSSLVLHFQHIIGGPKIVLVMSLSQ